MTVLTGPEERFQEFLSTFQLEKGEYKYRKRLGQLQNLGQHYVVVDFEDLLGRASAESSLEDPPHRPASCFMLGWSPMWRDLRNVSHPRSFEHEQMFRCDVAAFSPVVGDLTELGQVMRSRARRTQALKAAIIDSTASPRGWSESPLGSPPKVRLNHQLGYDSISRLLSTPNPGLRGLLCRLRQGPLYPV